ncbi:HAD-like domain-containing protein [Podospora fimiseda]|uniref:HAD-like domain-containing protein n=1 Tax=Podospora fimiseda TaxID=252190 RepID=A0AAN7H1M3_9PEZI|nr:HAD-like domain-containing protein [Podospora fimiseda]
MKRFWPIMMQSSSSIPWKFAPLNRPFVPAPGIRKLEGIVFDVDGTLCEPQTYMFQEMRTALGITKSQDILDYVYSLPTLSAQETAMSLIKSIESRAMLSQVAQPGLSTLIKYLDSKNIRKGICTRNFDAPVQNLLSKFLAGHEFTPIVTRDFRPPKPDPAGILHIAKSWGLFREAASDEEKGIPADEEENDLVRTEKGGKVADASALIMVGDSVDDITAGRRAGAKTVLLVNDVNKHLVDHEHTDLVISRLDELIHVLENGLL